MAGTFVKLLPAPVSTAGVQIQVFEATLDTTCVIGTGFQLVLAVEATYKTCVDASVHLKATWSGSTVTITGKSSATDVVNVVVFGI